MAGEKSVGLPSPPSPLALLHLPKSELSPRTLESIFLLSVSVNLATLSTSASRILRRVSFCECLGESAWCPQRSARLWPVSASPTFCRLGRFHCVDGPHLIYHSSADGHSAAASPRLLCIMMGVQYLFRAWGFSAKSTTRESWRGWLNVKDVRPSSGPTGELAGPRYDFWGSWPNRCPGTVCYENHHPGPFARLPRVHLVLSEVGAAVPSCALGGLGNTFGIYPTSLSSCNKLFLPYIGVFRPIAWYCHGSISIFREYLQLLLEKSNYRIYTYCIYTRIQFFIRVFLHKELLAYVIYPRGLESV